MSVRQYNIMMRCVLAILLSALFASCNEIEEEADPYNNTTKKEILSFSTYTSGATRATETTSADIKKTWANGGGFYVAAKYDGALYFNAGEKALCTSAAGNGVFDTDKDTYYWPGFTAGKMGFRAFNNVAGAAWTSGKEYESIDFTVADKVSAQKDLVIAYAEASSKPAGGIQPLNFTHALSKINISVVGADENLKYTINKIEILAASENAVMSYVDDQTTDVKPNSDKSDPDGNQPDKDEQKDKVNWSLTGIKGTEALVKSNATSTGSVAAQGTLYTYFDSQDNSDNDISVTGETPVEIKIGDAHPNAMLIPQSGKIAIRVYYKAESLKADGTVEKLIGNCGYYATTGDGSHNVEKKLTFTGIRGCKTLIVDLVDEPEENMPQAPKWEPGKAYRFTLELPTDNFNGDTDGDGVADMGVDGEIDLDGDGDKSASEFKYEEEEFIEFSVSFTTWTTISNGTTITIR